MKGDNSEPTSWEEDEDVKTIIDLPEDVTETDISTGELKTWAEKNGVSFSSDIKIPVSALILNCAPGGDAILAAEKEVLVDEATLEAIMEAVAGLSEGQSLGLSEIQVPASIKNKYPMATIEIIEAKELNSTDKSKFFKLQLKLK